MRKYRFLLTSIAILILLAVAGCSQVTSNENGTTSDGNSVEKEATGSHLVVAAAAYPENFDTVKSISGADYSFFYPVYETLVGLDQEAKLMPVLAKSWNFPDDKTIVFKLREGVKFHDGTPFDAEVVKFNLERVNTAESFLKDLENIESVEVIDPLTVQINLSVMDSSILNVMTDRAGMMLSPTALKEYGEDYHSNPVGTGPFKVVKTISNQEVQYEAFEDYWGEKKPSLDKLTFKIMPDENSQINALKSGQVHFAGASPANVKSLENDPDLKISVGKPKLVDNLYMNTSMAPLDNQKVRQAISYAFDREAISQALIEGYAEVASQPFPEGYWAYNDKVQAELNKDKARQLLEESGLSNVEIDVVYFTVGYFPQLAEITASQLAEVGIKVNLHPMEVNAAIAAYTEGTYNSFIARWSVKSDPKTTINALFRDHASLNPGKQSAPGLEDLYNESIQTYDEEERAGIYKEIVAKANEFGYMTHYHFIPEIFVMTKEVEGYEPHYIKGADFTWLKLNSK